MSVKHRADAQGPATPQATRNAKQLWLSQAIADLNEDERAMLFNAGDIIRRLAER